ncbi:MAG TPA: ATP-binding protein [Chloroflexota bacterium]|nr:ATP-binding protein [Chloroflexota bacterium]
MWRQHDASERPIGDDPWARATQLRQDLSSSLARAIDELDSRARELESTKTGLGQVIDDLQRERQSALDLFDYAPHPYIVTDENARIVKVNHAAAGLLNSLPAALLSQSWPETIGVNPVLFPRPNGKGGSEADGDVQLGADLRARVVRLPARSGPGERFLWHLRKTPSADGVGELLNADPGNGAISTTEQAPIATLRRAVDECVVGIVLVTDPVGEHVFLNRFAAKLLGRPDTSKQGLEQVDGSTYFLNGSPHALSALCRERILRGKTVIGETLYVKSRNGSQRWVRLCGGPVLDARGGLSGALLTVDDVTTIHDEQQRRAEWLSMVVHDLRAPLAIISGYAQLLQKDTTGQLTDSTEPRALQTIRSNAVRLNRMISDLLDASRIEISKLTLQRQRVDLVALVRRIAEDTQPTTPERPLEVVGGDNLTCLTLADPQRIEQVLDNLLQNAIKYGAPRTSIQLGVACSGSTARVWVTNQGPGIQPREANLLFRRFHRARAASQSKSGGLGLGLYIARGIVEAHGGKISVESVPNESTTFTVTLPAAIAEAAPGT